MQQRYVRCAERACARAASAMHRPSIRYLRSVMPAAPAPLLTTQATVHTSSPTGASSSASSSTERWAARLPDIPYGFPTATSDDSSLEAFAAERSGGLQKQWLQDLSHHVATSHVRGEHRLPSKSDFWRSPPYEALREVVLRTAYHDALKIIMEHDYTFLFDDVMCNDEAPMPHIIYEDFMKVLTFSSRQRPPEEQFALPEHVLRNLLCWAAYYCTLDTFYFTSASAFFRKVEQEQHLSPALHSAWVYVCTAAGKVEEAVDYAAYMDRHGIAFDPAVFAFMLHPSLTPVQHHLRHAPHTSKGVVLQRRLCLDMQQHHGTAAVAVHAMFVYHILTLRHTQKWEVLRMAAELQSRLRQQHNQQEQQHHQHRQHRPITAEALVASAAAPAEMISSRTMQLALSLFTSEKGIRWGARTTKAMVACMLAEPSAGATAADVLFVLLRVRRNERTPVLAELPRTVFTEEEQEALMALVDRASRSSPAFAVAAPVVRTLLAVDEQTVDELQHHQPPGPRRGSDEDVMHAMQNLQQLAMSLSKSSSREHRPALLNAATHGVDCGENTHSMKSDCDAVPVASLTASAGEALALRHAEAARDVLEMVMALDRESAKPATVQTSTEEAVVASLPPSGPTHSRERVASLHASLDALGASASLSTWSLQQAEKEAEEERLRTLTHTAWIAPTYQP